VRRDRSSNVTWHETRVDREAHESLNGHRGAVLWFTGLSGSGKSTVATELEHVLHGRGVHTFVLDGDNIRHGLNGDLGFSPEEREENIRRIGEVAHLFSEAGIIVLTAFISPYRKDRDRARALNDEGRFLEVYCRCGLETCEERDPKGLYAKARAGEIPEFTGISAPYEEPESPELLIDTDAMTVDEAVRRVVAVLEDRGLIPSQS